MTIGHQLNISQYYEGTWTAGQEDFSRYATFPNTRQLSVTSVIDEEPDSLRNNETASRILLMYENSNGNVTVLLSGIKGIDSGGTSPKDTSSGTTSYWIDISGYNRSILPSDFSPIYYNGVVNGSV